MLGIMVVRRFRGPYCEIVACVSKKDNFLFFFIEIQKNIFDLLKGPNTVTWGSIPGNCTVGFTCLGG